jgi:TonB-linked SusC/RagA family outer membrane protein
MKKIRNISLLCGLLLLSCIPTAAQRTTVTGRVTDQSGQPLTGVTVVLEGTNTGSGTDASGAYSISFNANSAATLVFDFLGFEQQKLAVAGRKAIDVTMREKSLRVDDVVVIGYGTVRRQDVAGSVSSPDMKDVLKAPVASIDEALAGRMAGVQVTSTEGEPGSNINIVIRGQNSVTQDNSPLYVIDGFPMVNFNFNTLNPSDIKSIDVLKDASATAIYGARGANGVIMIETKTGGDGATKITYEGSLGWQDVISQMEMMNSYDFILLQQEIGGSLFRQNYLKPDSQDRETRSLDYYKNVPYINWQDHAFRNATLQNHSIGISGGNQKTKFNASLNYMDQQGVVITSGFDRFTGRLRLDHTVNDRFKVGANAYYAQTTSYGATVRNANIGFSSDLTAMYNIWGYRPFSGDKSVDDFLNDDIDEEIHGTNAGNRVNPITTLNTENRNYITYNLTANAYGEYTLAKHLILRSTIGVNRNQGQNEIYYAPGHPATLLTGGSTKGINGSAQYTISTSILNENTLTYSNTFCEKHSLTAVAGFTDETYKYSNFKGEAWNIQRNLGISGLDDGDAQPLVSSRSSNTLLSLLWRAMYNFDERYYLTASFRQDGSSKFPTVNKNSYFPSVALMWRASNERLLKDSGVISDLKLRASYGETGNNRVGDFDYLSQLDLSSLKGYSWGNSTPVMGAEPNLLGNSDLRWETTSQLDAGVELGLFGNRITAVVEVYRKRTSDLLLNADMIPSSAYTKGRLNIGSVENKGLEVTLNTVNVAAKDFSWSSNFNIYFNRGKVLGLVAGQDHMLTTVNWNNAYQNLPLTIAQVGQPIAMFYGMRWLGNYQISDFTWQNDSDQSIPHAQRNYSLRDDVPGNGATRVQIRPGWIKYMDTGGNPLEINDDDRIMIGNPNPKFVGGFSNNFVYRNLDLNIFFQFSYGNQVMNANRILFEGTYRYGLNQFASYADRWSPENTGSRNYVPGSISNLYSDRTIEDASFLRLKTVQLGYNLPQKWVRKIHLQNVRLFISAQNLYTWTKYSGFDPEVSTSGNGTLAPGLDYLSYPRARTISTGINITF